MIDRFNLPQTYMGYKIVVNNNLPATKRIEDWSKSRSPSRAKRRLKRGFKQHLIITYEPIEEVYIIGDMMVMNSLSYEKFLKKMDENGRAVKQSDNPSSGISLLDRTEGKMQKHDFWGNYLWNNTSKPFHIERIYSA